MVKKKIKKPITKAEFARNFHKYFRRFLEESKLTRYRVTKDLGLNVLIVQDWYAGKYVPSSYHFYLLNKYYGFNFKSVEKISELE